MEDSIVVTVTGGRGSGKTLYLAFQGLANMIEGKTVWSNFPIHAIYQDRSGKRYRYDTLPLDMESLYSFDSGLAKGVLLIDEVNLWADSFASMAVSSRLLASVFQLVRKRQLSIFMSCQAFKFLNSRLRWQTDCLVSCFDMSHLYPNLERGAVISLTFKDLSGIFTGVPYSDDSDDYRHLRGDIRNEGHLTFYGKPFWGIYDSWQEFDVLGAMTKYKVERATRVIDSQGVIRDALGSADIDGMVKFYLDGVKASGVEKLSLSEAKEGLSAMGLTSDLRSYGPYLRRYGCQFHQSRNGDYYALNKS